MRLPIIIFGLCTLVAATATKEEQNIPLWDMIPLISQGKSVFQFIFGDNKGAEKTQSHFINDGFITSQIRSAYHLVTGEPKTALDIQKTFVSNLEKVVDALPLIGHVKGLVHLLVDDREHGFDILKSATSTTGTLAGGILGGPTGAIGGHVFTDVFISAVDAIFNKNESQPHGLVNYFNNIDNSTPGDHFDVIAGLLFDQMVGKVPEVRSLSRARRIKYKKIADDEIELLDINNEPRTWIQRNVGQP